MLAPAKVGQTQGVLLKIQSFVFVKCKIPENHFLERPTE